VTGGSHDPARVGYAGAGESWATDASLAYVPLARHLIAACPDPLPGTLALDAGAGTGVAAAALHERGACVVAADLQEDMIRSAHCTARAVVADVGSLPFCAGAFDVVIGAFVLNHLADPVSGLAEMTRVCRRGGVVMASTFSADRAAAKSLVDEVAASHGWAAPDWYHEFRTRASRLSSVEHMSCVAATAGLGDVEVTESVVDIGLDDPSDVARYRLGMPQLASFVRGLPDAQAQSLRDEVVAAITASGEPFRPAVIELVARAR